MEDLMEGKDYEGEFEDDAFEDEVKASQKEIGVGESYTAPLEVETKKEGKPPTPDEKDFHEDDDLLEVAMVGDIPAPQTEEFSNTKEAEVTAKEPPQLITKLDAPKDTPPAPQFKPATPVSTKPAPASKKELPPTMPREEEKFEGTIIEKMKMQNSKLKKEFAMLKQKLEECIEKAKHGNKPQASEKEGPTEEDMTREQELRSIELKTSQYKKQIQAMKRQLEGSFNIDKIVALENEEKAKKKIIQELEGEKHSLLRIQKEQKRAMDVMINEKELKKKRDQLKEELREKKNELKEKQNLLRKQEKQMKDQHESLISLEEKCRKLQSLIYEKKAGLGGPSEEKTEADVQALEEEIKGLEQTRDEEKRKYKQMITTQENRIKELSLQIDTLNIELKQKDQECRLNALKINELKRQLRLNISKPPADPISTKMPQISKDVEEVKNNMKAEHETEENLTPPEKVEEPMKTEDFAENPPPNKIESEKEKVVTPPEKVPTSLPENPPKSSEKTSEPPKPEPAQQNVYSKPMIGLGKKKK